MFGSSVIREGGWGDPNSSALFFFKGLTWQDTANPPTGIKAVGRQTCLKCKYPNGLKAATERSENSVFFLFMPKKTKQFRFIFPADNKILGDLSTNARFYVLFLRFFVMFLYCHVLMNIQSSG